MNETLSEYLAFLWEQFQYDWSWMSNPWVLYTLFPEAAYLAFFVVKWTVLLAPVTIPIMVWKWRYSIPVCHNKKKDNNYINN